MSNIQKYIIADMQMPINPSRRGGADILQLHAALLLQQTFSGTRIFIIHKIPLSIGLEFVTAM